MALFYCWYTVACIIFAIGVVSGTDGIGDWHWGSIVTYMIAVAVLAPAFLLFLIGKALASYLTRLQ